jgi:hypothetical protein
MFQFDEPVGELTITDHAFQTSTINDDDCTEVVIDTEFACCNTMDAVWCYRGNIYFQKLINGSERVLMCTDQTGTESVICSYAVYFPTALFATTAVFSDGCAFIACEDQHLYAKVDLDTLECTVYTVVCKTRILPWNQFVLTRLHSSIGLAYCPKTSKTWKFPSNIAATDNFLENCKSCNAGRSIVLHTLDRIVPTSRMYNGRMIFVRPNRLLYVGEERYMYTQLNENDEYIIISEQVLKFVLFDYSGNALARYKVTKRWPYPGDLVDCSLNGSILIVLLRRGRQYHAMICTLDLSI